MLQRLLGFHRLGFFGKWCNFSVAENCASEVSFCIMHPLKLWRKTLPQGQRTLQAVAELLGVTEPQVSRYENGKRRIPPKKLERYEKITGIPRYILRPDLFLPASNDAR
ncbi:helix-turn-helix transcriptional regulator [Sinorhizobium fredii]|uniref:helix-turn-helix transcriptional regulator n=1 Tax=Rhizobium fredii TaxID=380 RepID=UPI0030A6E08F